MTKHLKLTDIKVPWFVPGIVHWADAFCSCAIEGNVLGQHMCELWNTDQRQFLVELEWFLYGGREWDGDKWIVLKERG